MTILLIDTSRPEALLVLDRAGKLIRRSWRATPQLGGELLGALDEVLTESALELDDIDRFAAHSGPGHFSALRTGIVVATMLAQALQKDLVSVSGDDEAGLVSSAREGKPVTIIKADYNK